VKVYIVRTVDKNYNENIRGIFETREDADTFGMIYFGYKYHVEEYPVRRFKITDMSYPGDKDYDI
jgi:hypothetical protein